MKLTKLYHMLLIIAALLSGSIVGYQISITSFQHKNVYMEGYWFFFENIANESIVGYTDGLGNITIDAEQKNPNMVYSICVHEVLHNLLKEEPSKEHEIISQLQDKITIPMCDRLVK